MECMEEGFLQLALQVAKDPRVIAVTVLMVVVIALANYVVGYKKRVKVPKKKKVAAPPPPPKPAEGEEEAGDAEE